jgi:hypothetical protein
MVGLILSPITWEHHFLFFTFPGYFMLTSFFERKMWLLTAVSIGIFVTVLVRLPGEINLVARPIGTVLALLLGFRLPNVFAATDTPDSSAILIQ